METSVAKILSTDFINKYSQFLRSETKAQSHLGLNEEEFVKTFLSAIPPLNALIDGASGSLSEKVVFEGLLAFSIIDLFGPGKLPASAVDYSVINFSNSYDLAKKNIPFLKKFENLSQEEEKL